MTVCESLEEYGFEFSLMELRYDCHAHRFTNLVFDHCSNEGKRQTTEHCLIYCSQ